MADLSYEVTFKGVASATIRAGFDDCELGTGAGTTWVRCSHAALHDVVGRIEEFGLDLLDVRLIAELRTEDAAPPQTGSSSDGR